MENNTTRESLFSRQTWIIITVIGFVGLIFLLRNHTSHVFSVIPYLVLLLCPLLHIFMHKGHVGHNKDRNRQKDDNQSHASH